MTLEEEVFKGATAFPVSATRNGRTDLQLQCEIVQRVGNESRSKGHTLARKLRLRPAFTFRILNLVYSMLVSTFTYRWCSIRSLLGSSYNVTSSRPGYWTLLEIYPQSNNNTLTYKKKHDLFIAKNAVWWFSVRFGMNREGLKGSKILAR